MGEVLERRAFVGRAAELARLSASLAAVRGGRGRTIVVGGEAGIGKTRLIEKFTDEARVPGAVVLAGGCLKISGGELPYGPFVEILREIVRAARPEHVPALLGPGRADLARLLPELAPHPSEPPPAVLADPDRTSQTRLFELILGVIARQARSAPVLLVVEDIQWADRSTRDLLRFLVRSLRDDPVLIVLTLRVESLVDLPDDPSFLPELEREGNVERFDLRPFGREEVTQQATLLLGEPAEPAFVDQLLKRADGNPFYVEELVLARALPGGSLPPVLRDVLSSRLRAMSPVAQDVLRAAAVAGRRIDDQLLSTALGIPPRRLGTALREAVERGVLVRVEGSPGAGDEAQSYAFRHELLREVADAQVFPIERAELHAAFAAALEARGAAGRAVAAAEIAHHWDEAGRPENALGPTVEAAINADQVYAFADALRLWSRAAALALIAPAALRELTLDRVDLLERAAEAAVLAGEYERGVELGREAVASVDPARDPVRSGHLHERLRWYLWEAGDRSAAAEAVHEALRLLPRDAPSSSLARALGQQAGVELLAARYEQARALATQAVEVARAADASAEEAFALGILGWSEAVLGDVDGGVGRFREGARLAQELGSVEGMALAASSLVSLLDRIGRPAEALAAALEGYALTERYGVTRTYGGLLLGFVAKAQLALGRWEDADRSTTEGLRLRPTGRSELWLQVNRGRLQACRGVFAEAQTLLQRARETDERLGHTEFRMPLLAAVAELAVWSRRPAAARTVVKEALGIPQPPLLPDPGLAWVAALGLRGLADEAIEARIARDAGREREIYATAEELIAAVGAAEASMGAAIRREGDRGAALEGLIAAEAARMRGVMDPGAWREIAAIWERLGRPFHLAYARYREAESLLQARAPREDAQRAVQSVYETTVRLEAAPLRRDVETLARQARLRLDAGDPAGRDRVDGSSADGGGALSPYHFTEREREVLRLVAGGWSNQQIADVLFITRKTASVHVSNILSKLGVESRGEAAAIAHRVGLGADAPTPPPRS